MDTLPPRRKRMRLKDYDYSQHNGYFVTIDVLNRRPILGSVASGDVLLSELGREISEAWKALDERHPELIVDEWILMPDHLHRILVHTSVDTSAQLPNLIDVVRRFKSHTTRIYHKYKERHGLMDWPTQLWQRGYYERVIRGAHDLEEKRNYICTNPRRWELKQAGLV